MDGDPAQDAESRQRSTNVMRNLFGRDLVYFLLWGSQMGAATLITPIITRVLGAEKFGMVALAMSVMQLLVALGTLGLDTALQRAYAQDGERNARRLMTLAIVTACAVSLTAYLTGPLWSRMLGLKTFQVSLEYAVLWAGSTALTDAGLALLRSRDQLRAFATINLVQTVLSQLVSLALMFGIRRTADEYILGQLLTQLVAAAAAIVLVRPLPMRLRDLGLARWSFRYSLPLVPAAVSGFVVGASNRLFVQHNGGARSVAHFTIPYNIGSIPMLLLWALTVMWMPRVFAVAQTDTRTSVLAQSRDGVYALLAPMLIGFSATAPVLLHIWAPSSILNKDSMSVMIVILVASIPYAAYLSHSRGLMAAGITVPVAIATVAGGAINVVLNIVLLPPFGIVGSAVATLSAYVSMYCVLRVFSLRSEQLPAPGRALLVVLGVSGAIAAVLPLLPPGAPFLVLRAALAVASLVMVPAILLTLTGREDRVHPRRVADWLSTTLGIRPL